MEETLDIVSPEVRTILNDLIHQIEYEHNGEYAKLYKKELSKNQQLQNNWNELKEYFEKKLNELELYKEEISIDDYVDRKSFLKDVLNKFEEIESKW